LEHTASRAAVVGDKLVVSKFQTTITRGFASADAPDTAICLLPGTELAFDSEIKRDEFYNQLAVKLGSSVARFTKVNNEQPYAHHDALELPGGDTVLLTYLEVGQTATVLQMPAAALPVKGDEPAEAKVIEETVAKEIVTV
jgi:hypothetical protein